MTPQSLKARDDPSGERADVHGATAADMLVELDTRIASHSDAADFHRRRGRYERAAEFDRRERTIRAIREVIVTIAPYLCATCGEFIPAWLSGGDIACPGCGARRHLSQASGDAAHPAIVASGEAGGSDGLPADHSRSPDAVPDSPAVDDAAALSRDGAAAENAGGAT